MQTQPLRSAPSEWVSARDVYCVIECPPSFFPVVDVRPAAAFEACHAPTTVNIDVGALVAATGDKPTWATLEAHLRKIGRSGTFSPPHLCCAIVMGMEDGDNNALLLQTILREHLLSVSCVHGGFAEFRQQYGCVCISSAQVAQAAASSENRLVMVNCPSEIAPNLFLGSVHAIDTPGMLERLGITHVLDAAQEVDPVSGAQVTVHWMQLTDDELCTIPLDEAVHWIETALQGRGRVLVHCSLGVSRSPSLVIAYLMRHYGWSAREALCYCKSLRAVTRPNNNFLRQLFQYQWTLRKAGTLPVEAGVKPEQLTGLFRLMPGTSLEEDIVQLERSAARTAIAVAAMAACAAFVTSTGM